MKNSIVKFIISACIFSACREESKRIQPEDTPAKGTINISADESFAPVIREQIAEYEASFPGTHINATFKTEANCLKDLFRDSLTRMVIVTRGLSDKEEKYMLDSLSYTPAWNSIASDAVAVIVNTKSTDSVFTMDDLRTQLTGKAAKKLTPVFDGLNQTSTVRFVKDSILKGRDFDTSVVKAVNNSDEVLAYIADHENAIGFVGINRIGNPEDTAQVRLLKKLKICYIKCDVCNDQPFVFPSQQSILNHRYPLVRGLYYILKENYTGLGAGFVSFLKYERGQLIFRRAYLGPIMEFGVRDVRINENLPQN